MAWWHVTETVKKTTQVGAWASHAHPRAPTRLQKKQNLILMGCLPPDLSHVPRFPNNFQQSPPTTMVWHVNLNSCQVHTMHKACAQKTVVNSTTTYSKGHAINGNQTVQTFPKTRKQCVRIIYKKYLRIFSRNIKSKPYDININDEACASQKEALRKVPQK